GTPLTCQTCEPQAGCTAPCVAQPLICRTPDLCSVGTCDAASPTAATNGCVYSEVECPEGQTCDQATGGCKPRPSCSPPCASDLACCGTACVDATSDSNN